MIMEELLQAALSYAELGFKVFPLLPGEKTPATENGLLDATTDPKLIEETWRNRPFNIGICTDGLIVVDIDGKNNRWLTTLGERAYDLIGCPAVRTPSGGSHRYYKQPFDGNYRNTQSEIAYKVDTRADGGYVVAPPSVLEAGGGYQWIEEFELTADLSEPPKWLLDLLESKEPKSAPSVRVDEPSGGNPIPSGQRNSTLASLAGTMRRVGMPEAEIVAALHAANCGRCQPPLPAAEVVKIAHSVSRYQPDQIATGVAEGHYYQMTGAKQAKPFPVELLRPPGFLSQVIDFNLAGAHRKQPILALAGALALLATITGRKVQDDVGTRTNLYILGVGGSGCGKDRARVVNKELLYKAGAQALIGPESPASASGLVSAVHSQPSILFQWDEMGRLLQTLSGKFVSPHLANISTVLMKLFTSSSSIYLGDAYSDSKKNIAINQPHAVLYGTTVPKNLFENLSADSVSDGFMGRLLIFESETPHPDHEQPQAIDPSPMVATIREWLEQRGGNLSPQNPDPAVIPSNRGALDLWQRFRDECLELERAAEENSPLWARAPEKARKLALLHACSRGATEIGAADANWGRSLAMYLTERLTDVGEDWIAGSHFESNCKRIRRWLKSQPDGVATVRELTRRAARSLTRKEREMAIDGLEDLGTLVKWTEDTNGRPTTKVRLVANTEIALSNNKIDCHTAAAEPATV